MSRLVAALVYARKTGSAMRKSILAYMAERANDDGSGVWCSKQRIALEIEASRGSVITNIQQMVDEGLLIEEGWRPHQNGKTMEYSINLKALAALPKSIPDDPFKIERVEEGPVQQDDATRSASEQQDVQQDDTNRPKTVLEPSIIAREVFEHYNQVALASGWTIHSKLTDAIKSPLKARIDEYGADQVKTFIDALSELPWTSKGFATNPNFRASLTYICRPRTFAEHFDKLVTSRPAKAARTAHSDEIDHRLDWCFERFAKGEGWHGGRYAWTWEPDLPEAAGRYPEALYAKHGVRRPPQGAAA